MERHIVDAIRMLDRAYETTGNLWGRLTLLHAIKYLANPDRFLRPKRGSSNVKGGKQRAKNVHGA